MIAQLTGAERRVAMGILGLVALAGLVMAAVGRGDPLGVHGFIVLAFSGGAVLPGRQRDLRPRAVAGAVRRLLRRPDQGRHHPRAGLGGRRHGHGRLGRGAARLAGAHASTRAWSSFGRLRPVHTSGVIFGFGGNALIATSFHVMQRTSRARLPGQLSPWFVLLGFNLFCVIAASGYLMGVTQSKEYAEPEWYADIWLVVVWVTYFVLYIRTLARRNEPHIYVANWYYLAFILVVAVLHIVNNLAVPASFAGAKSYSAFSGVQDAMTQWWYGHNAVAFFLTAGFLGMLYYYPAEAGGAADLFLPAVDPELLGHHLLLHLGRLAPPALHRAAALGADARHDLLGDAAGAVLVVGGQRADDAERRLAQGARRRDAALHDGGGGVLRALDLRGLVHGDPRR